MPVTDSCWACLKNTDWWYVSDRVSVYCYDSKLAIKKKPPKLANPHLICLLNPVSLSKQYSMFTAALTAMSQNIQRSNNLISKCVYSYVIYKYWLLCPANVDWKDSKASQNIFETSCFSLHYAVFSCENHRNGEQFGFRSPEPGPGPSVSICCCSFCGGAH